MIMPFYLHEKEGDEARRLLDAYFMRTIQCRWDALAQGPESYRARLEQSPHTIAFRSSKSPLLGTMCICAADRGAISFSLILDDAPPDAGALRWIYSCLTAAGYWMRASSPAMEELRFPPELFPGMPDVLRL